jgi:hypothetical protein
MSFFGLYLDADDIPLSLRFEHGRRAECKPPTESDVALFLQRVSHRVKLARARRYLLKHRIQPRVVFGSLPKQPRGFWRA